MSTPARAKDNQREALQRSLLAWYRGNSRDLPWRRTRDPYAIWVSEIMLQQTRVAAVLEKYAQFMERFSSVKALADARVEDVLTVWSGLGYYRRARALHQAARIVAHHLHERFPSTAAEWRELPGIGRYTSAAIASIAFQEPVAVVDGNVERVIERLSGERCQGEKLWGHAQEMLAAEAPGDWNQAMMELGATVCLPKQPQCLLCPIREWCHAKGATETQPQPKRKRAELWYDLYAQKKRVLLVQRPADLSLMAGMWELPPGAPRKKPRPAHKLRHSITDTDYAVFVVTGGGEAPQGTWVTYDEAMQLALTGLTRKILRLHFA
jgi:A/G-specific adenine glycosylase